MDKAEQKWLSVGICPKCGIDLRTHRDINGDIDQAICINNNCNFKYPEATNDNKPDLDKLIEKYQDALNALSEIKQFTPPDNPTFPQFAKGMCEIYEIFVNDLKGLRDL